MRRCFPSGRPRETQNPCAERPALLCRLERVAVIAHRGASAHALEHTWKAYDLAVEMGADALEIDVRSTADGELVAIHDATLERTTGDPREVADTALTALGDVPATVRPPTLGAIFERYGPRTHYWVDLKAPDEQTERAVLELIARHGVEGVGLQSFDPECIDRLSAVEGAPPLVQLYRRAVPPEVVLGDLDRVARRGAVAIGRAHELVDETLIAAVRSRGLEVHTYTVNERDEIERVLALGVSALITDAPDRAREVVDGYVSA